MMGGPRLIESVPTFEADPDPALAAERSHFAFEEAPAGLSTQALLLLTAAFWSFVTLTDIVYAEGMRIDVAQVTSFMVFAPWPHRLLQHLLVFPLLLVCYRASQRIGWAPALKRVPLQIGVGLAFAAVPYWLMDVADIVFYLGEGWPLRELTWNPTRADMGAWVASAVSAILAYSFGLALVSGVALYRRYHGLQLRNAELRGDWAGARLAALRTQLSPHTLFNLLYNIQAQIAWDPEVAQSLVVSLADLLRRLLRAGEQDFSLLAEELEFVQLYLRIQSQRFADRLTVQLPQRDALPAVWVPSLILQPLIENAVVHGLANHTGPARIAVSIELSSSEMRLRVVNSMAAGAFRDGSGIGLRNVRERLKVQFGDRARLEAGPANATTWVAEIRLPALREWQPPRPVPEALPLS
jgi:two-component system, LytTR family, sensor kinase